MTQISSSSSSSKAAQTNETVGWIAAVNAMNFYVKLKEARDYAIDNHEPWRKVLFDISDEGQISNPRLEEEEEEKEGN